MADTENKTQDQTTISEEKKSDDKPAGSKISSIILLVLVVIVCLAGGYLIGRMILSGPASAKAAATPAATSKPETHSEKSKEEKQNEKTTEKAQPKEHSKTPSDGITPWDFELEPVIANLDEPGVTRYVRATIILQMSPAYDQEKGTTMLEEKKAMLRDWLTIYLAGCTLEEARGSKNLVRIKAEIQDAFNDFLFKNSKPMVESILLKEFAVQ